MEAGAQRTHSLSNTSVNHCSRARSLESRGYFVPAISPFTRMYVNTHTHKNVRPNESTFTRARTPDWVAAAASRPAAENTVRTTQLPTPCGPHVPGIN